MVDRTTKALLLAIAIGLWMNLASQWFRPAPVQAQALDGSRVESDVISIESHLRGLQDDLLKSALDVAFIGTEVAQVASGTCKNKKIC